MKVFLTASLIGLTLAAATPSFADNRAPGVHQRQHNQKARIADGVRSGELTKEEARSLRTQQRAIRAEKREFKSDGQLSRAERRELHSDQNEASRDIYREKHDNDKR
jgi:hypothetical protein